MDPPPSSRRVRKPPTPKPDIYSTVVVHESDAESEPESEPNFKSTKPKTEPDNIFSTMIYKAEEEGEEEEDEDEESLPPLLKRLPKDFGGTDPFDDGGGDVSGTMIVKTGRVMNRSPPRYYSRPRRGYPYDDEDEEEDEDGDGDLSGTVVRRTRGGGGGGGDGGGGGGTMRMAVESMKASVESRFVRKGSGALSSKQGGGGGGGGEGGEQRSKVSSSSIPDSVTREDPSTKYELLNELGT